MILLDSKNIEIILDDLISSYNDLIKSEKESIENYISFSYFTQFSENFTLKNDSFFSNLNCKSIETNMKIILKYNEKSSSTFYSFGICLSVVSILLLISALFIIIINNLISNE